MVTHRRLSFAVAVVVVSLSFFAALVSPAQADAKQRPYTISSDIIPAATCLTYMENPHSSTGSGGVIAKLRYCTTGPLYKVDAVLKLYMCSDPPTLGEVSPQIGSCVTKATTSYTIPTPTVNNPYTRYIPPLGQPGVHGTGWWSATATITEYTTSTSSSTYSVSSQTVFVNG